MTMTMTMTMTPEIQLPQENPNLNVVLDWDMETETEIRREYHENDPIGVYSKDSEINKSNEVFADIRHHYKLRVDYHKAEKSLTLQCKAMLRRMCDGDKDAANKM